MIVISMGEKKTGGKFAKRAFMLFDYFGHNNLKQAFSI
jgi:hypothetical protein